MAAVNKCFGRHSFLEEWNTEKGPPPCLVTMYLAKESPQTTEDISESFISGGSFVSYIPT